MPTSSLLPPVPPEIFGLNGWVRGVADRLSAAGVPALAMPLSARTAPELKLGYEPQIEELHFFRFSSFDLQPARSWFGEAFREVTGRVEA